MAMLEIFLKIQENITISILKRQTTELIKKNKTSKQKLNR